MPLDPEAIVKHWRWPGTITVHPLADSGLINDTWSVALDGRAHAILQRLNPRIFQPTVHLDIEGITRHLSRKGLLSPRLIPTRDGTLWHEDTNGHAWRCFTRVGDRTLHKITAPAQARSAGGLVARFHGALSDLRWRFHHVRSGAHDTRAHMSALRQAIERHPDHPLHAAVAPLAREILERWARWRGPEDLPPRIIHGDLKISNLRFDTTDRAVSVIDLDTLAMGTLDTELGDALRSWCNPSLEDDPEARIDLEIFDAAITGYAAHAEPGAVEAREWAAIVPGLERITLELAARFARDTVEEAYFGWDATRYPSRGLHNLHRTRGQLGLARSIRRRADDADDCIRRATRS